MKTQDKREQDVNGYLLVKDNPISKVGVYPYLGKEIGAPEADRVYHVYRPAEELSSPETISSFNLIPFIDEHEFLGEGGTPAEKKGVQGTTGENALFEFPYLKNSLRIYSNFMKELLEKGKTELSPAYRCDYVEEAGEFEGQTYQYVQRNIRGNHLALVAKGRTGPDVAVLDSYSITTDSAEFITMDKLTPEMIEQIKALFVQLMAEQAAGAAGDEPKDDENGDEVIDPETPSDATEAVAEASEVVEEVKEALKEAEAIIEEALVEDGKNAKEALPRLRKAMDALTITRVRTKTKVEKPAAPTLDAAAPTLDAATVIKQIAERDALAKRLQPHIGTFDTSEMVTASDVAKYGIKTLGIKAMDGAELAVLEGYLQATKAPSETIVTQDGKASKGSANAFWKE